MRTREGLFMLAAACLLLLAGKPVQADSGNDFGNMPDFSGQIQSLKKLAADQASARQTQAQSQVPDPTQAKGCKTLDCAVEMLKAIPAKASEEAVVNVLRLMRARLKYEAWGGRGPHEWTAEQAFQQATFNGCVEAAKIFFALFHGAYRFEAAYVDSYNADCPSGGHAVVEVTWSDGQPILVDATAFEHFPESWHEGRHDDILGELRTPGLILDYADSGQTSFRHFGECMKDGQRVEQPSARHVIYGCYRDFHQDQADRLEPGFRAEGKGIPCGAALK